jgi:hypothetical protein
LKQSHFEARLSLGLTRLQLAAKLDIIMVTLGARADKAKSRIYGAIFN